MKITYLTFAAVAALASGSASADQLLLTGANNTKASATSIAIDLVSDGTTRSFDFVIPVAKGAKVDTSKCLSGLPKGFQGTCQYNDGEISALVFAWEKISLEAGIHSIGSLTVSSNAVSENEAVKFSSGNVESQEISGSAKMTLEGSAARSPVGAQQQ